MSEQFIGEIWSDLVDFRFAKNDLFQELRLRARCTRRDRKREVNEEMKAVVAMRALLVTDVADHLIDQFITVDRFRVQPLLFAGFDFVQVVSVYAHFGIRMWQPTYRASR